ncbi:uncharacterized protein LOC120632251 [Pararge aegeria]|uniref:uncharacterized protein LOC120632251 n=1 Tax=Pararge aegeria TaxID=116150 RepID=UPI0019D0D902|nr:uncharacterized protein LOC120632251 [Pararge aegeria]
MGKLYGIVLFLLAADYVSPLNQYVFEFGQNTGTVIYKYDGTIPLLQISTNKDIIVPPGATVTYVRVTVNAVSPPKVDYDADTNRVSISYSWTQITMSTYSIVVKGHY